FFFSSRRRHTRSDRDWSSDVCSSDLWASLDQNAESAGIGGRWRSGRIGNRTERIAGAHRGAGDRGWNRGERIIAFEPAGNFCGRSEERRVGKEWWWGGWRVGLEQKQR